MKQWLKVQWCAFTHGGGTIERDKQNRINWRCRKCGRWSDSPVSHEDEARVAARDRERAKNA